MREFLYSQSSLLIAALLLLSLIAVIEIGYRVGRVRQAACDDTFRSHVNTVQASVLGLMALLLGFTFSMALQRFDGRSDAVVDEANAIGTTYLRSQFLPEPVRQEAGTLLRHYVDLRVTTGRIALDRPEERQALIMQSTAVLDQLWALAGRAVALDPSPSTSGLFIQTLNEMIDSFGRRDAILNRHVPELVLWLLYSTVLLTGGVLGYACGIGGHRPSVVSFVFGLMIVVVAVVIIDIDRPRRGLIQVDQSSLVNLGAAIDAAVSPRDQIPPSPTAVPR